MRLSISYRVTVKLVYTEQTGPCPLITVCLCRPAQDLIQFQSVLLPVDPARAFIRLDVHLIQIDVDLGYFHLEAVGQKLDWLPNGAIARSPWQREKGLGSNGSYKNTCQK